MAPALKAMKFLCVLNYPVQQQRCLLFQQRGRRPEAKVIFTEWCEEVFVLRRVGETAGQLQ